MSRESWSSLLCTESGVATRTDPPPASLSLRMSLSLRHTVKLGTHKKALEEAGDQGLPFTKGPLFFETTGAMGEETQKWWNSIVEMEADQRMPGAPQSRREQGLEHTWSANKFSSYWLQTFSMSHARMQAEFIAQWIGTCQKA